MLKFLSFQDFINDYFVFIVIGLALILAVLFGVFISIKLKKKNYIRQLQLAQQEYIAVRQIALPDAISKLETLAIKNISFVKIYKESNSRFYEINDTFNGKINEKFESVQKAANDNDYKVFHKEINDLKTSYLKDTVKLGNAYKYEEGIYPLLYKRKKDGTYKDELVPHQDKIKIK